MFSMDSLITFLIGFALGALATWVLMPQLQKFRGTPPSAQTDGGGDPSQRLFETLVSAPSMRGPAQEKDSNLWEYLSPREREVALLVVQGYSNTAIAAEMQIKEKTVETHLRAIYDTLQVRSRLELMNRYRDIAH